MKYSEFEHIITANRLHRYEVACSGNKQLARYLYRQNIILAEEMFGVINMFEIALRNAIDRYYSAQYGTDWLKNAIADGGRLDNGRCGKTKSIISYAYTHKVGELFSCWSKSKRVSPSSIYPLSYLHFAPMAGD